MHGESKHARNNSPVKVGRGVWILLAIFVLAVWVPAFSYIGWRIWRENRADVLPRIDVSSGHNFMYDLKRLGIHEAVWFTYPVGSERYRLALQKDSSGKIRSVVASCKACYSFRNAHEFKNGQLMCGRCRHAMRLGDPDEKITPAKGCVAVPVPFSTDDRMLTVRAADIEERLRDVQSTEIPKSSIKP